MLVVRAKLDKSPIHGFGIFALQFIPKGAKVWEYHRGLDVMMSPEEFRALPEVVREQIEAHVYRCRETGDYVLCVDNARFMNHSVEANTMDEGPGYESSTIASRDIQIGEEITCDYFTFDADADQTLSKNPR